MRSTTPPDFAGRCRRCFMRTQWCLCALVPRVETRTRFWVLRHSKESFKATNTARLAALAMPNLELVDYGAGPGAPLDERCLLEPGTWLMFPEEGGPTAPSDAPPPSRVVVLDGSWSQARKMLQRVTGLRNLPRLRVRPVAPDVPRLRGEPDDVSVSTLEAIARAVALLEGEDKARQLDDLHTLLVERVLAGRGQRVAPNLRD